MHATPYVTGVNSTQPPLQLNPVFSDAEYVPIRAKIQTSELSYNGTIMLNRDDLLRAINLLNYQFNPAQERNSFSVS